MTTPFRGLYRTTAGRKPTIDGGFDDTNVRFGSKPDISLIGCDVRFTPESGHGWARSRCPLCAKTRHSAPQQKLSLFDHLVGEGPAP
jgi:hypothetical protein